MLQVFSELDELVSTPFYLDKPYLFDEYRDYIIANNLSQGIQRYAISDYDARSSYFRHKLNLIEFNIYKYVTSVTSSALTKEKLILDVELIFNKIGDLRSKFHLNNMSFDGLLRADVESGNLVNANLIYLRMEGLLDNLYKKVESTYGYLMSKAFLKKFNLSPRLSDGLRDVFRDARKEEFKKYTDAKIKDIYAQQSLPLAMLYINNQIAFNRQQLLNTKSEMEKYDQDDLSYYLFTNYQERIDWLQIELEKLQADTKVLEMDNTKQKPEVILPAPQTEKTSMTKLKTSLTVNQFALLYNLLIEEKVIEGTKVDFAVFISQNFGSKASDNISPESLVNKFNEITDKDRDRVKTILSKMCTSKQLNITAPTKKQ